MFIPDDPCHGHHDRRKPNNAREEYLRSYQFFVVAGRIHRYNLPWRITSFFTSSASVFPLLAVIRFMAYHFLLSVR